MNYASYPNANYRVDVDWGIGCSSTRVLISTSRSNIKHQGIALDILPATANDIMVTLYPNPANDHIIIELSAVTKNAELKIINVLGQTVFNETIVASSDKIMKQINTENFAKGIYTVVIEMNTEKVFKKLVIN